MPAMPCLWDRFLHTSVTLCPRRYCILVYSVLGELISYANYALHEEPVPALTNDPAYPAMLYTRLFGPGRVN